MSDTKYLAGLYLRLSKDDERAGESVSIENQRLLLTNYAQEKGWGLLFGAKILAVMIHSRFCGQISAPILIDIIVENDCPNVPQPLILLGNLDLVLLYRKGRL